MNNQRDHRLHQQGFTIIEMIVYGSVLALFLVVLTTLFTSILDMQLGSEATSGVAQDGRYLFSRFAYDIARASAIVIPASLGDETSSLQLTIGGEAYTYTLNSGVLEVTNAAGTNALNSVETTVSGLSFRRYGNMGGKHSVRIMFTLTSTTQKTSGREVRNFQTMLGLR